MAKKKKKIDVFFRQLALLTWKTVSMAMENELKLEGGVPSWKLNVPPNNCIPRRAKMRMKRNSNNSKDTMDFIELSSDTTRFRKEDQYLKINPKCVLKVISSNHESASNYSFLLIFIILIKWMLCIYNHTICIWCLQWGNKQVCAKKRVFWLTPGGGNTISWNWLQEVDYLLFEWPPNHVPSVQR